MQEEEEEEEKKKVDLNQGVTIILTRLSHIPFSVKLFIQFLIYVLIPLYQLMNNNCHEAQ